MPLSSLRTLDMWVLGDGENSEHWILLYVIASALAPPDAYRRTWMLSVLPELWTPEPLHPWTLASVS